MCLTKNGMTEAESDLGTPSIQRSSYWREREIARERGKGEEGERVSERERKRGTVRKREGVKQCRESVT